LEFATSLMTMGCHWQADISQVIRQEHTLKSWRSVAKTQTVITIF